MWAKGRPRLFVLEVLEENGGGEGGGGGVAASDVVECSESVISMNSSS